MPMNRELYPPNWEEIAQAVKDEADWICEECRRPCRRPGESRDDFLLRIPGPWVDDLYDSVVTDSGRLKWQRFTLTVAHLDHDPANCDRSNLRALCAPCHCRYDLSQMARKKRLKQERAG